MVPNIGQPANHPKTVEELMKTHARTMSSKPQLRIYIYIHIHTGRTKVALVELPTVNMCGFFFYTPFPPRILTWGCVVPR